MSKIKHLTGKSISILLAICMFTTLFTCLMGVQFASASASDTKMLHAKATAAGLKFGWRSSSSDPLAKGTSIGILGNIKADQTLTVTIDGTNYVLSGSDATNITEYPIANELADINHTVTITANGSGPYVAIAAVAVGS